LSVEVIFRVYNKLHCVWLVTALLVWPLTLCVGGSVIIIMIMIVKTFVERRWVQGCRDAADDAEYLYIVIGL